MTNNEYRSVKQPLQGILKITGWHFIEPSRDPVTNMQMQVSEQVNGMINRRIHQRYRAKSGSFALLRSTSIELNRIRDMGMGEIGFAVIRSRPIKMGQIINISKNGLAFEYLERQSKSIEVFKLDLLYAEDAYYLGKLLFRPIFDYAVDAEIPFDSFTIRRCGVEFGELTAQQESKLEYFLNQHTLPEEPVSYGPRPLQNDEIRSSSKSRVANYIM